MLYETDLEPFLDLLPKGMSSAHTLPRVQVTAVQSSTTYGDYNEVGVKMFVEFHGKPYVYGPHAMVGALPGQLAPDAALALGRELMGANKKIGHIEFRRSAGHVVVTMERPLGKRLMTLTVRAQERVSAEELANRPESQDSSTSWDMLSLRLIPDVEGGPPESAKLVKFEVSRGASDGSIHIGPASIEYSYSPDDLWAVLPANRVLLGKVVADHDFVIPRQGEVVYDYNNDGTDF